MKYVFLSLILMSVIISCTNPTQSTITVFEPDISIEPNLVQDSNGYYHLYVERSSRQTIHGISLNTNYNGSTRVEWEASSTWIYNHAGVEFDIPVINSVSYTSPGDGTAQTLFAPVVELVGDTVTVFVWTNNVIDSVNIVLE